MYRDIIGYLDILTYSGLNKMADVLQAIFSYAFLWNKLFILIEVSLKYVP